MEHTSSIFIGIGRLGRCLARSHSWSRIALRGGDASNAIDAKLGNSILSRGIMWSSKTVGTARGANQNVYKYGSEIFLISNCEYL